MSDFRVICLVGSVKQEAEWRKWARKLTMEGFVVLEAGLYGTVGKDINQNIWDMVTMIHQQKIRMSDVVAFIKKADGSVGRDTQADIDYARLHGKEIVPVERVR